MAESFDDTGMDKRELFAAIVLAGLHANSEETEFTNMEQVDAFHIGMIKIAVRQADRLLSELSK